ncbi:Uma2 family endonuclease [Tundrisphaera lichenicola]|uniref:Uma2 family endonuclease n=1 Tax=Tundrisphaera lichenicola TaxID=2029860 RepID=UPI003EBA1FC9
MSTSTTKNSSTHSIETVPPLRNGDHLSADEFLRRYEAMPDLKKAELIDGRVYIPSVDAYLSARSHSSMSSLVSFENHSAPHFDLITWLGIYRASTIGVRGGDNGTVRLEPRSVPQPDAFLLILPDLGGRTALGEDGYIQGAPELVAEVSFSSVSYDLHEKLDAYQRSGTLEYVVWRVEEGKIDWFVAREGRFERLNPGPDGLLKSEVFPGLWLDVEALIRGDLSAVFGAVQRGLATVEHADFVGRLRRADAES